MTWLVAIVLVVATLIGAPLFAVIGAGAFVGQLVLTITGNDRSQTPVGRRTRSPSSRQPVKNVLGSMNGSRSSGMRQAIGAQMPSDENGRTTATLIPLPPSSFGIEQSSRRTVASFPAAKHPIVSKH
jgi:hypothetical protein